MVTLNSLSTLYLMHISNEYTSWQRVEISTETDTKKVH